MADRAGWTFGLAGFLAERDFQVRLAPVAEDGQGDRIAGRVVAQSPEEVAVSLYPGVAEGGDNVSLPYSGVGGRATRHYLLHQRPRVHGQFELGGVFGAQVGGKDAQVGRRDLARGDQLVRDGYRGVGRYCETEVLGAGLGRGEVGHVHAYDEAVTVGQGAARIAGGDGGIGLYQVDQSIRLRATPGEFRRKLPAHGAYYARGHRGLEARRAADRDGQLADYGGVLVEPGGRQVVAVHLQHGYFGVRVRADHARAFRGAVGEGHVHARGVRHDVVVGDDVTVGAVDHTAPNALAPLRTKGRLLHRPDVDLHHAGPDLRGGERDRLVRRYAGGGMRRCLRRSLGRVVVVPL